MSVVITFKIRSKSPHNHCGISHLASGSGRERENTRRVHVLLILQGPSYLCNFVLIYDNDGIGLNNNLDIQRFVHL